jgi:hypothetical protein
MRHLRLISTGRVRPLYVSAVGLTGLAATLTLVSTASSTRNVETACSPSTTILKSPAWARWRFRRRR